MDYGRLARQSRARALCRSGWRIANALNRFDTRTRAEDGILISEKPNWQVRCSVNFGNESQPSATLDRYPADPLFVAHRSIL
jgi:hypothetical protein